MTFGLHLIFDAYKCDREVLRDVESLRNFLHSLPEQLDMFAISTPVVVEVGPNNKKDPGGVSGFVMISESHISFHTFPNRGFLTADIYTCQDTLDTDVIISKLCDYFKTDDFDVQTIKRGTRYPDTDLYAS